MDEPEAIVGKLRENEGNCERVREIAEVWGKLRNSRKLRESVDLNPPPPLHTHFLRETRDTTTRSHNVNEDENKREGRALVTETNSSGHKQKVRQGPF